MGTLFCGLGGLLCLLWAFHVPGDGALAWVSRLCWRRVQDGGAEVSHVCLRPAARLVGSLAVRVSDAASCEQLKAGLTSGPSLRQQSWRICLVLSIPSGFFFLIYLVIVSCAGSLSLGRLFSSCGERRLLSSQGGGLLAAVASAGEQRLSGAWAPVAEARGSGCSSRDLDRRLSSGGARPHRPRHAGSSQTRIPYPEPRGRPSSAFN